MPRFAANLTMMFNEVPFLDRFAAAAAAGFTAVEFLFPYEHDKALVAAKVSDAGLDVALFNMPPGNWGIGERGLAVRPERSAEFSAALSLALDYAAALAVPRLHMMAGIAPASDSAARARYLDSLREATDAAGAASVDVLIEPLNRRDMPGYFLDSFHRAVEIIETLGRPNLKLQYDIYHRQIMHGDVSRSLADLLPHIGHIQIASVPDRHEPGTGELDDARLFTLIDSIGYLGFIGCEYRPLAATLDGLHWRKALGGGSGGGGR